MNTTECPDCLGSGGGYDSEEEWCDCRKCDGTGKFEIQYVLFAGEHYYPDGGAGDFRGFGNVEELKKLFAEQHRGWFRECGENADCWGQIVEHHTMKEVLTCSHRHGGEPVWVDA